MATFSEILSLGGTSQMVNAGSDVYGKKPIVPGEIDYEDSLRDIIQSNINLLPSLTELGLMSTDSLNALLERTLPGFTKLRDTTTGILGDKLKGKIPRDVQQLLERNAAEKGIALGTSGSQFGQFDELRNLGLTSLGIQNEGLSQTSSWLAQNRGNTFDISKFLLGKEEAVSETQFNWQRNWLAAQVKAAPNPVARGNFDTEMAINGMVLGAYAGAAPQQRYQPSYQGGGGAGTMQYGEQAAMGGRTYFGETGATIGYTPTNYNYGGAESAGWGGSAFDSPAGATGSPMFE